MRELQTYTELLLREANIHLSKEYNLSSFKIPAFQAINFYLLDSAISKNKCLFIKLNNADQSDLVYFPTVLSVAISLFFKNFCDDKTSYEIGENVYRNGVTYQIKEINDSQIVLWSNYQGGVKITINRRDLKKYIITTSELSKRKFKAKFNDYRELFKLVFAVVDFPSKFQYKAVMILEKKEFEEELKYQDYTDIDLLRAIPLQWITKTGTAQATHIPIDPMIYLVPDYETFKEHVLGRDSKIETVILIGRNKYREETLMKLKRDLREELIPNAIIIGNEPIEDSDNQFIKWNWTFPELAKLSEIPAAEIHSIGIDNNNFVTAISKYLAYVKTLENQHVIDLSSLNRFRKRLYSLILPTNQNSRLINQVENIKQLMTKETAALIGDALYSQNENPQQYVEKATGLINEVFNEYRNVKLNIICSKNDFEILVVPDFHVKIWKDEFKARLKILSLKEFIEGQSSYKITKRAVFLSLFGYNKSNREFYGPKELIDIICKTRHQYYFLCYPEEAIWLTSLHNCYFNYLLSEYQSEQRKTLTGIEFHIEQKPVEVSDLIEELNLKSEEERKSYEYESGQVQVNYVLSFEESPDKIVCDGSKCVLFETSTEKRKERISYLRPGDRVRIYSNVSKERLFDIAVSEDKEGRFKKIDEDSKIWKAALLKCFTNKSHSNTFYTENDLLNALKSKGSTITSLFTLKKWMNMDDKERFPNAIQNFLAIKELIQDPDLDANFESIKKSRRFFRSIMIALGRDLSDEVMDFVISDEKAKGKMLSKFSDEEVKSLVGQSAPLRIIKNIQITEEDETN